MYQCECLNCGEGIQTDRHCRDLSCPVCGGQMRRLERPGTGNPVANGVPEPTCPNPWIYFLIGLGVGVVGTAIVKSKKGG